jgi:hypothetical protein
MEKSYPSSHAASLAPAVPSIPESFRGLFLALRRLAISSANLRRQHEVYVNDVAALQLLAQAQIPFLAGICIE